MSWAACDAYFIYFIYKAKKGQVYGFIFNISIRSAVLLLQRQKKCKHSQKKSI